LVLVSIGLVGAGCGRLGFNGTALGDPVVPDGPIVPDGGPGDGDAGSGRLVPQVCGVQAYSPLQLRHVTDLSIAPMPGGAAVFAVSGNGDLVGFLVNSDAGLSSSLATVRSGPFLASGAAYIDDTLIAMVVTSTPDAYIDIVNPDLSPNKRIASISSYTHASKQAVLHAGSDRVAPLSCEVIAVSPFDASWTQMTSPLNVETSETTGMATVQLGAGALVAVSTASDCHVELITDPATSNGSSQPFRCPSPRIANDGSAVSRLMFEGDDGVRAVSVDGRQLATTSHLIAAGATSPRILFDGQRYWTSYLDRTGAIAVGIDDGASLVTTQVPGVSPAHDAYELALIDGVPWVVAVDGSGASAHKLCLVPATVTGR
jgi:hypothetical protein